MALTGSTEAKLLQDHNRKEQDKAKQPHKTNQMLIENKFECTKGGH